MALPLEWDVCKCHLSVKYVNNVFQPVMSGSIAFIFEMKGILGPLISMAVGTVTATGLLCHIERYCLVYRSATNTNTNDGIR